MAPNIQEYLSLKAISEDNTKASVTPQHCKTGQTASAIPANNVGATLELSTKSTYFEF